jgi:hypothetical protein
MVHHNNSIHFDIPIDDLFSAPPVRTSRPATGGRRGAVRGFSPEGTDESPFETTPVLAKSVAPDSPPKAATTAATKKITDDWDDEDLDIDIDSLLTGSDKPKARVLPNDSLRGNKHQSKPRHEPLDDSVENFSLPETKPHSTRPNSAPAAAQEREIEPIVTREEPDKPSGDGPSQPKNTDEDVDLGFVPSFLESGRETRSRR